MDAPIAIPHARFGNLFDTLLEVGLLIPGRFIVMGGTWSDKDTASSPDANLPNGYQLIHQFPATGRRQALELSLDTVLKHSLVER